MTRRESLLGLAISPALSQSASNPIQLSALEMAALLRAKKISARELLAAHLAQINRLNPHVNAIVTLVPELAQRAAASADEHQAQGKPLGPLHGLPIAHKDLINTKGIRTTFGSRIYKDFVPDTDDLLVERCRAAGAILLGKTNTPEFGAGSQTFNEVFGATKNPYDLSKTCGGSSGGAAVALATRMLPIADGSDHGGSLRNPAAFCNVVGFRGSTGRVPTPGYFANSVQGAMARSVADLALLLSALAGPHPSAPLSLPEPGSLFRPPLQRVSVSTR
jgi:amidase